MSCTFTTCVRFFSGQQLFIFLFVFGQILQWTIGYSAEYWKLIFSTALVIVHIIKCACAKLPNFYFSSEIRRHHCVPWPWFPVGCANSGDLRTLNAEIGIFVCAWIFRTFWSKMAILGGKIRQGVVRYWPPNELVLTFGGCYLCTTFGENQSRNATVRVRTDRHTDIQMDTCTETNWIYNLSHDICYRYEANNKANGQLLCLNYRVATLQTTV